MNWAKRLDGVVNNAAIADPKVGPVERLALAKWQRFLDVNLTGAFLVTKHAVRHLRKTRGAIVNMRSRSASAPRSAWNDAQDDLHVND